MIKAAALLVYHILWPHWQDINMILPFASVVHDPTTPLEPQTYVRAPLLAQDHVSVFDLNEYDDVFGALQTHRIPCNLGGIDRSRSGFPVEVKAVNESHSAEKREDSLRYSDLVGPFRSLRSELLRNKVIYFTLGSFALLPFGVLGLFWFFEYTDRKTRRRGATLSLLLPVAFVLLIYGLIW